jgi:predicted nucleotidyltransferase
MRIDARAVLERRQRERERLLSVARGFTDALPAALQVRAVCVFGSVARGDFNVWSDIDVLVVAEPLPDHPVHRLEALGPPVPRVQAVVWTPQEWSQRRRRGDPIAVEAIRRGVWLVGGPQDLP